LKVSANVKIYVLCFEIIVPHLVTKNSKARQGLRSSQHFWDSITGILVWTQQKKR